MLTDEMIISTARKLRLAGRDIRMRRDRNASELGLTSTQADALEYVVSNSGCKIVDLGIGMSVSHQAACKIIDRLVESGLIKVEQSTQDARAKVLTPTSKGEGTYSDFIRMGVEVNSDLFSNLEEDEVHELRILLDKLCR